jgi:hypothetical protein
MNHLMHHTILINLAQRLAIRRRTQRGLLAAAFCTFVGCSEKLPAQLPAEPSATVEVDAGPVDSAELRRTVATRNPFGATEVRGNLVADGDFEFTGRQQQMPWLSFSSRSQATLNFETGGRCRSGIRCGAVKQGESVIGWVASPKDGALDVAIAIRPSSGICKDVVVRFIDVESDLRNTTIRPPAEPDADGYCSFRGSAPALADGNPALFVDVVTSRDPKVINTAILDSAVVTAVPMRVLPGPALQGERMLQWDALDAAALAKVRFMRAWIRSHRSFGLPKEPPPENPRRLFQ